MSAGGINGPPLQQVVFNCVNCAQPLTVEFKQDAPGTGERRVTGKFCSACGLRYQPAEWETI